MTIQRPMRAALIGVLLLFPIDGTFAAVAAGVYFAIAAVELALWVNQRVD